MKSTGRISSALRGLWNRSYDRCQSCGLQLPHNAPALAGYAVDGSPLYVGDCCSSLVSELATHVYWWWESDKRCAPELRLWRYMDFARLVAILDARSLYFARADQLGDNFEGASGALDLRQRWVDFYLAFFKEAIRSAPGRLEPVPDEEVETEAQRLLQEFSASVLSERNQFFVSCWHANVGESEALWRLYCPSETAGVAIATTARRLSDVLADQPVKIGTVQYVDMTSGFPGVHERIFSKRKSLSHESEVRAVIRLQGPPEQVGIQVPVNLEELVVRVVPSPFAPTWFPAVLKATLARFGVDLPLSKSELLAEPFF